LISASRANLQSQRQVLELTRDRAGKGQKSILNALQEVHTALVAYANEQDRRASLESAVQSDEQSLALAQQLYKQGLADFINVLDAQRTLFTSEDALARSDRTVSANLVALYKALGGGWQIENENHN